MQDEGEELWKWVNTEDINLEGKVQSKGNIISTLIRLEGKVKDEGDVICKLTGLQDDVNLQMLLHIPIANWRGIFLSQTIYIQRFLSSEKTNKKKELNIEWMLSEMHNGMGTCLGVVL